MTIDDDEAMRIATFRFGVIADLVTSSRFAYGEREKILKQKETREWQIPGSNRSRISRATLISWITAYKKASNNLEALKPKRRSDRGKYRKLDGTLRMAVRRLKTENPHYTLAVIITKLKHERILKHDDKINASSVYRFIKNEKLDEAATEPVDRRRFEAEYPNEIWQCDVMHGPHVKIDGSGGNRKSYLCAILDDHSRLIVHAQFYINETLGALKDCLRLAVAKRGIPQKFYVDNGACYRADNLEQILALLGIGLTHSKPYTPQGRGKIERWFGTVRQSFIPLYANRTLTLNEINERLDSWVDEYNATVHSMTGMTPYDRFKNNLSCVRPAPDNLISYFRNAEFRRVKKDRTVFLDCHVFEVAVGLIDKKVELRFHPENPHDVEVFFEGRSFGKALPLNARVNARIGRDGDVVKNKPREINVTHEDKPRSGKLFTPAAEASHE